MALVEYGSIITDIRGSIGGLTFQHTKSGKIARLKPSPFKHQNQSQQDKHKIVTSAVAQWHDLTLSEKLSWNAYADVNQREDRFGRMRSLTGFNWFYSINYNRLALGETFVKTPRLILYPFNQEA